jgi:endogenous inhibitor of DNA gyrase (YacG/DUF329 family)
MIEKYKFKELYLKENKTGKYSKEKHIEKNYKNIYDDIKSYSIIYNFSNLSFKEKVYLYLNDFKQLPVCEECGKKVNFQNSKLGYRKFCSVKCSSLNLDVQKKSKNTNIEKYGVEHPSKNENIRNKYKQTCLEKYGVEHISKTDNYKMKYKQTCLEKYGVENVFQNIDIKDKIKKTNLKKYGVDYVLKNNKIKNKQYETSVSKYGDYYNNTDEYRVKFKKSFIKRFKNKLIIKSIDNENICECECDCGKDHIFRVPKYVIYNRLKSGLKVCNICNSTYYISGGQVQVKDFIEKYYNVLMSERKIINGELDIYIPDLKLAFEFNGLYWHNELYKDKNYHLNKTELCEDQGIQLIHIWEDDWSYKQDIVKSMILSKLNKIDVKIDSNDCEVKEIMDTKLITEFLDKNHIQGYIRSSIKIGLFHNNDLVSLMTFSKKQNEYKILRYCVKLNIEIVDGLIKLFNYFKEKYKPSLINLIIDRSYDNGKQFQEIGFKLNEKTRPNRLNRKNYNIYDSGYLKFLFQ